MSFGAAFAVVMCMVYLGNVGGCGMLCDTIPELNRVSRFAWHAPLVTAAMPIKILFEPGLEHRGQKMLKFFRTPNKNLVTLITMLKVLEEFEANKQNQDDLGIKE